MRTSALWQSETLRLVVGRSARRRRRALPCRRPSLAMLKGKSVWVKDPELAEGDVFCRGSCISDDGGKARTLPLRPRPLPLRSALCARR